MGVTDRLQGRLIPSHAYRRHVANSSNVAACTEPADLIWLPRTRRRVGGTAASAGDTWRAIADPTRLRLLSLVATRPDGEACVCEMADPVGPTQGTVSHHQRVLVDTRLLNREQRGKWAYYRLVPGGLTQLAQLVGNLST